MLSPANPVQESYYVVIFATVMQLSNANISHKPLKFQHLVRETPALLIARRHKVSVIVSISSYSQHIVVNLYILYV